MATGDGSDSTDDGSGSSYNDLFDESSFSSNYQSSDAKSTSSNIVTPLKQNKQNSYYCRWRVCPTIIDKLRL